MAEVKELHLRFIDANNGTHVHDPERTPEFNIFLHQLFLPPVPATANDERQAVD